MAMADVEVKDEGAFSFVTSGTEQGEEFIDAWLLGVLSVEDAGRITVTSEVVGDLSRAAEGRGLTVEVG